MGNHTHHCMYCGNIGDCLIPNCRMAGTRVRACPWCPEKHSIEVQLEKLDQRITGVG